MTLLLVFRKEISAIRKFAYLRAMLDSFRMISKVSIFLCLTSYVFFGNVITARKVFVVSSYFVLLNDSIIYLWPLTITEM